MRLLFFVVVSLAVFAASGTASAQTNVIPSGAAYIDRVYNGFTLRPGTGPVSAEAMSMLERTYGSGVSGAGSTVVRETYRTTLGGANITVTGSRSIPWASVRTAAQAAGRIAVPFLAVPLIYDFIHNRMGLNQDASSPSGFAYPGGAQSQTGTTYTGAEGRKWAVESQAARDQFLTSCNQDPRNNGGGCTLTDLAEVDQPNIWQACVKNADGTNASCPGRTQVAQNAETRCYDPFSGAVTVAPTGGVCPNSPARAITQAEFNSAADNNIGNVANPAGIVGEALGAGVTVGGAGSLQLSGPSTLNTGSTQSTGTTQSGTITQTTTTRNDYTYMGDTVTYNTVTVNTTNNNGTTTTTTTNSSTLDQPAEDIETCGLPGKPACKIDETGTPTGQNVATAANQELTQSRTDAINGVNSAASAQGKNTAWSFSFALPTGCTPFQVWGATSVSPAMTVNMCQYQPVIHDLMSMIWAAATVFCLIAMFGRAGES